MKVMRSAVASLVVLLLGLPAPPALCAQSDTKRPLKNETEVPADGKWVDTGVDVKVWV